MSQLEYYTTIGHYLLLAIGFIGAAGIISVTITLLYIFGPYVGKR